VTGREAAATMHHAYSAQVYVARVLDWSQQVGPAPSKLDDWLAWVRRARDHAEKLCRCFPTLEVGGTARIAEWAERWPQDYGEAADSNKPSDGNAGTPRRRRRCTARPQYCPLEFAEHTNQGLWPPELQAVQAIMTRCSVGLDLGGLPVGKNVRSATSGFIRTFAQPVRQPVSSRCLVQAQQKTCPARRRPFRCQSRASIDFAPSVVVRSL
jgi:hypothetical protein